MASTFIGLSIAERGLAASQTGLATTSTNISNVNTTGYSRQVVNQIAIGPAAIYSSSSKVGSGTEVTSVDRVRSFRLDQKYWQSNGKLGYWETRSTYLTEIETVLGDGDEDGFSNIMSEFNSALESVSADPSSSSARKTLVEAGNSVCAYLNDASERLTQLRSDVNSDIKTTVEQINSYAKQIASLNQQISTASAAGASANELEDQRDALIDKLSALADIEVVQTETGVAADGTTVQTYIISINGNTLVNGSKARELECYTITDGSDQNGMYGIRWKDTGEVFDAGNTGTLKAYLDLRDGNGTNGESKGILYYIEQLDKFARNFAQAFNEGTANYNGHADGVGLDGSTGIRFFSYDGLSSADMMAGGVDTDAVYSNITAANITLSKDVQEDVNKIAAASSSGESGNNENADDLISILSDMGNGSSPVEVYASVIASLGTESDYAQRQYDRQNNIVTYIDNSRSSVSGVSTDEETANLTKYQQAYNASAQMISTWNEIYETTIDMVD